MTRPGYEDIEGGLLKFLGTRKGGSEKIRGGLQKFVYFKTNRRGWGSPKKLNRYRGGLLKFQSSLSFNIFVPPLVILKELSLKDLF